VPSSSASASVLYVSTSANSGSDFGREDAKCSDGVILLRQVAATFCSIQSIRHDTSLKEKTDAPQENHAGGTPGLGAVWAGGPGSGLTAGASLRKATLIECDPALALCARLLTIEIFLKRNMGLRQMQRARAAQDVSKFQFPGLPGPKRAQ
jgi:hypothetical protein